MSWLLPGDPGAPAQLPVPRMYAHHVMHNGRLLVMGGYASTAWVMLDTVLAYDFGADTWSTLDPLSFITDTWLRAPVSLGDWVYLTYGSNGVNFARYNPDTGVTETLTASGMTHQGLAVLGGLIYQGFGADPTAPPSSLKLRSYDPGTDAWTDAPNISSPYEGDFGEDHPGLYSDGDGVIVVRDVFGANVYRYSADGTWATLPSTGDRRLVPGIGRTPAASLALLGGDTDGYLRTTATLPAAGSSWDTESVPAPMFDLIWPNIGQLDARFVVAGGQRASDDEPTTDTAFYDAPDPPIVPADLDVGVDVIYPWETTEAYLSVEADVLGGPGLTADLLLAVVTGRSRTADLVATVDVDDEPSERAIPEPE